MDKFTLPPTPSWHLSNILTCNDNGLFAYGSRYDVTIIDLVSKGKFNVSFLYYAHKDKINVVVFSPIKGSFKNCLATCGDDGSVRVWDFEESRLLYCHSGHKEGLRVTGLDWSRADTNRIVSVNDLGTVVCWDLASNTVRRLHCGSRVLPLCLACCPHDKDLVAIGCRNGIILVVDIKGSGKIVHRLRGHEQDVISVSWCPVPYNVIRHKRAQDTKAGGDSGSEEGDNARDLLLATGGVEKSIFIWRTGSDGRFEVVLNLPNNSMSSNYNPRKKGMNNNSVNWTCVHWADPYTLLSTSQFGELLAWDLRRVYPISDKPNYKKPQPSLLHSIHYKGCFSIACPVSTETLGKSDERMVWTTAIDKHIVGCKLSTGSIVLDLPTLGGSVFSMALSPLDPNRLAIGSSDSKVFVWNLSDLESLQINTYWKKIVGKVMALSWHPQEENWLAYGTSDGHVGLLDVGSNKLPTLFRLHHRKQVYRLCWAPRLLPAGVDHGDKLALFSVGDGDIFQFAADIAEPNEEPLSLNGAFLNAIDQSFNLQKNLVRSDIVFKQDNSCFAVGNENGSVYIVSCKSLSLRHVIYPHQKLMNNLEWHPETVASDNNISPYKNWLAATCDSVKVYNIPDEGQPEVVATLSGHSEKIVGLAWSPHYNGRLLSASYDDSVQVWDVPSQSCLGIYLKHSMSVMCALFSPLDPDFIISGSGDNTVRLWNMSELQSSTAKPEKKKKDRLDKKLKNQRVEVQEATELTVGMSDLSISSKTDSKKDSASNLSSSLNSSSQSQTSTSNKGVEDFKKRQKSRAVFNITGPKLTQAKHFDALYQRWASPSSSSTPTVEPEEKPEQAPSLEELGYLDFFGDGKSMLRLLMVEENHLSQRKQHELVQHSMLWRGDVSELISQAITKKQLSDWLVSLAPMAGFDVWEAACEAYAAQLAECGDVVKASSYLLFIHKVHEAVRMLADYKQFREAIAIAKCRLPSDDELTAQVYREWGNTNRYQGSLELAAHCFLAAGNMQTCIETLARIKDLKSLKMAATLASHQGLPDMASSLATECLTMAVVAGNLAVGHQLVKEMPQYQFWRVWLCASEVVSKVKNRSEADALSWVAGWRSAPISLWDHLNSTCATVGPSYSKLLPNLPTNKTPKFERDVWYTVSGQLAAAWGAQQEATLAHSLRHLVTALSAAFHFQSSHPSSTVALLTLAIIAPHGPFGEGSILVKEYESAEEKELIKSLKAFVCAAIVHWLSNNWNKVSSMKLNASNENETEESSKEDEFKVDWLVELITKCSAEVLDKENISFFVKKAQKEELLNLVSKENIKKNAEKKSESLGKEKSNQKVEDGSDEPVSEETSTGCVENKETKKTNEDSNLTTEKSERQKEHCEDKSTTGDTKLHSVSDPKQLTSNGNGAKFEGAANGTGVKISSKDEQSKNVVANEIPNGSLSKQGSNEKMKIQSTDSIQANGNEPNAKSAEIQKLEEALSRFESVRVAVPSPFTAYTNIKYLLNNVISKSGPEVVQQLQEYCDNLWRKSQH